MSCAVTEAVAGANLLGLVAVCSTGHCLATAPLNRKLWIRIRNMALGDKYPLTVLVSLGRSDRLIIREHGDNEYGIDFPAKTDVPSVATLATSNGPGWGALVLHGPLLPSNALLQATNSRDDPTCLWWDIISSNLSGRPLNKAPPTSSRKKNKSVTRYCITPVSKRPKRKLRLIARQPKHISKKHH